MSTTVETPIEYERKPLPPAPVSFEEFLAWTDEDTHAEWVDGEIVLMSPVNIEHQRVLSFLHDLVKQFVLAHQLGEVFFAPFLMRLRTRPSGREPDLLFVANEHLDRLRETYIDGPADLVVEIVSPDSTGRDRGEKYAEYEGAGVPEYWVVDPLRRDAGFNVLGGDGRYHPVPPDAEGFYYSTVLPGFRLRVEWLWQRPLPQIGEVIRQIEA
jgi:Uma2 family endonuclease